MKYRNPFPAWLVKTTGNNTEVLTTELVKTTGTTTEVLTTELVKTTGTNTEVLTTGLVKTQGTNTEVLTTELVKITGTNTEAEKNICVFTVTCQKNLGSVGRNQLQCFIYSTASFLSELRAKKVEKLHNSSFYRNFRK
jgi:hypothetical protein